MCLGHRPQATEPKTPELPHRGMGVTEGFESWDWSIQSYSELKTFLDLPFMAPERVCSGLADCLFPLLHSKEGGLDFCFAATAGR
jgi:hypothetical protein